MWNRQFTYNKLCKTPLWNHLGSNKLHTREPSDTTGYIRNKKNFTMRVRLLCGAHVVWDCLFNTGYPGFGVPVPLFIGYLISNLILLKTNDVSLGEYLVNKYSLWFDFRTIDENELHGMGRRIENASEGITLEIKQKAESAGALNYIYLIRDAQLNIQSGTYVSAIY